MSTIAAVVLSLNEEKNIGRCLRSLQWTDERIVVDCGSTDQTVSLAEKLATKVLYHPWSGYAEQRNYGCQQSECEWILNVDCDEEIPADLADEILGAIESRGFSGFQVPMKNYMFGRWMRHGGLWPQYHLRLFKRQDAYWEGNVHEDVRVAGQVGRLKAAMVHHAYDSVSQLVEKVDKYTDLEAKKLAQRGEKPTLWKVAYWSIGMLFYKYVVQQGFRDGLPGLLWASSLGYYQVLRWAKLWDMYRIAEE